MAESSDKFNGTVTWIDVRTGFCLIRSNDSSSDELFIHKSFITALDFIPPTVGETVEVLVVERNNDDPEKLDPTCTGKSYIQRWRHLVKSDEDEIIGKVEERNWAMLPCDILSIIFKKAGAAVVIASAQFVCKPWRQLSKEAHLWKCVDIKLKDALSISTEMSNDDLNKVLLEFIAMVAVDRSDGCLEEFSVDGFGTNVLMNYMAERTPLLRGLHMISVSIDEETLVETLKNKPKLEELEMSYCFFSHKIVERVGPVCPQLKSFRLDQRTYNFQHTIRSRHNAAALAIAKHFKQLHRLQLFANCLTSTGLEAILDNCPHLEYLDIRNCYNVGFLDESLKSKCAGIKELRLANDSDSDYEYVVEGFEPEDSDFMAPRSRTESDWGYSTPDDYTNIYGDWDNDGDDFL